MTEGTFLFLRQEHEQIQTGRLAHSDATLDKMNRVTHFVGTADLPQ